MSVSDLHPVQAATGPSCRADVWLWRARFFKTRADAAQMIAAGRIRRLRDAAEVRLDKASRSLRSGDGLVFAHQGRVVAVRVLAMGDRRGPPAEARGLYRELGECGSGGDAQA